MIVGKYFVYMKFVVLNLFGTYLKVTNFGGFTVIWIQRKQDIQRRMPVN